jgi:hypothetical protein
MHKKTFFRCFMIVVVLAAICTLEDCKPHTHTHQHQTQGDLGSCSLLEFYRIRTKFILVVCVYRAPQKHRHNKDAEARMTKMNIINQRMILLTCMHNEGDSRFPGSDCTNVEGLSF